MTNKSKRKKRRLKKKIRNFLILIILIALITIAFCSLKIFNNIEPNNENKTKVVIDIGHGGNDQGTKNLKTGTLEKDITLQISNKVIKKLSEDKTIQVIPTRTEDKYVSLVDRNKIERENNAELFVSIHCNAAPNDASNIEGVETFYWKEDDKKSATLAQKIHNNITLSLDVNDRGVKKEAYEVLRNSKCPSVLIETGFLTNNREESNLLDQSYQENMADAIYKGIKEYLQIQVDKQVQQQNKEIN
ncbi:N-acetylmuramoyl-L-alanine amidase [Romboutsia maritimum]|uniref:N-acetylmuramoyl-L-alanine amidase n=1 Tax=Romboutsia maritimum TaxID=2020948 RepID=A0A371IRR1_9FIRM|nr:N-acetylmuramoyl-L-alanine amidase [Romboutsia maritimum]RDY23161.1 N-acetylmuramoyl-L-alanine amidase [Romboutsia maritimum]